VPTGVLEPAPLLRRDARGPIGAIKSQIWERHPLAPSSAASSF